MKQKLIGSGLLIGVVWSIFLIDFLLHLSLNELGILPRHIVGLRGVLFSPFLHGDFMHLISNTAPLFFLTLILFAVYPRLALIVWISIAILGGIIVWIIARPALHIGASGVIYGLASFLIASGIFRRNLKSFFIAVLIFFLYGGIIWGIFPTMPWVSWEGHLAGFISGIFLAYTLRNKAGQEEKSEA